MVSSSQGTNGHQRQGHSATQQSSSPEWCPRLQDTSFLMPPDQGGIKQDSQSWPPTPQGALKALGPTRILCWLPLTGPSGSLGSSTQSKGPEQFPGKPCCSLERQQAGKAEESLKGNLLPPWPSAHTLSPGSARVWGQGTDRSFGLGILQKMVNLYHAGLVCWMTTRGLMLAEG